jgi:hypothetical protein
MLTVTAAWAQWLTYPTAGIPRTPDGQADLAAPTPRTPDGKPDLSGLWEHDNPLKYLINVAADLDEVPLQPWAKQLFDERVARRGTDDPNSAIACRIEQKPVFSRGARLNHAPPSAEVLCRTP